MTRLWDWWLVATLWVLELFLPEEWAPTHTTEGSDA